MLTFFLGNRCTFSFASLALLKIDKYKKDIGINSYDINSKDEIDLALEVYGCLAVIHKAAYRIKDQSSIAVRQFA